MASTPTRLMTFAEFERLPDPPGGRYELHHGELIFVAPPKHRRYHIQRRLERLLDAAAGNLWVAGIEMPFRAKPEHEFWYADVGVLSAKQYASVDPDGNIQGAPDLVIEVLSPSNAVAEMLDRRQTCLENGSREFWLVNPDGGTIEVSTPDGRSIVYTRGQEVPLFFGGTIPLNEIFG